MAATKINIPYLVVIWHAMGMARSGKSDAIDTAAF
jgi:hypothetical protein